MDLKTQLGFCPEQPPTCLPDPRIVQYINLKLAALGCPVFESLADHDVQAMATPLLDNHREKDRLLAQYLCPADQRIQDFISRYLAEEMPADGLRLPARTFVL